MGTTLSNKDFYTDEFYASKKDESIMSAKEVLPIVLNYLSPNSVLDIGCGIGGWLRVVMENGVSDIIGVDGDYVNTDKLFIPQTNFIPHDLSEPINLNRKFDLVMSLEVAEHITADKAEVFVENIVNHGSVILFSAAIVHQGGTNHINEQWPQYWINIFAKKGYIAVDFLRSKVWNNPNVGFWYAQNMLIFVHKDQIDNYPEFKKSIITGIDQIFPAVHPKQWLMAQQQNIYLINENTTFRILCSKSFKQNIQQFLNSHKSKNIAFYGVTKFVQEIINSFEMPEVNIIGIVDSDPAFQGKYLGKYPIYNFEDVKEKQIETIVITALKYPETIESVTETIKSKGLNLEVIANLIGPL